MRPNKSQAAFEFIILVGVMMMVFVMFFAIVGEQIMDMNEARRDKIAEDVLDTIVGEIEIAHQSADGYSRNFTLPDYVEGSPYEVSVYYNRVVVMQFQGKIFNRQLPFDLAGVSTVYKGINQIKKLNGEISIINGNDPCYAGGVNIAGDNSYCVGGICYCHSGYYASICEQEGDTTLSKADCGAGCITFDNCNPAPGIEPDESRPYAPAVKVSDIKDTTAKLSFTTNETAKAVIRYGLYDLASGYCPDWDEMSLEVGDYNFKKSFEITLKDMHANTEYCFRIMVNDSKRAWQEYSDTIRPVNTLTTLADESPPKVRYALIFPVLIPESPYHEYNQKVELFVNITDDTGIDISNTKATIKQKQSDGSEIEVLTLSSLADTDSDCDSDPQRDVYNDDGYMQCFWTDSQFARYASYDKTESGTLFYARYDTKFDADFAKGNGVATTADLIATDADDIAPGRYGNGAKIDADERLSYAALNNFDANNGTIEFWLRPVENTGKIQYLFYEDSGTDAFSIFRFGNSITFSIVSAGSWVVDSGSLTLDANSWYFIAVAWENVNSGRDDGEMHMYLNGAGVSDETGIKIDSSMGSGSTLYIGSYPLGTLGVDTAHAVIDQFRILNVAKTEAEILKDYETKRDYYIYFETRDTASPPHSGSYAPADYSGTSSFPVNYKVP